MSLLLGGKSLVGLVDTRMKKCSKHQTSSIHCFSHTQREEVDPECMLEVLEDSWISLHDEAVCRLESYITRLATSASK